MKAFASSLSVLWTAVLLLFSEAFTTQASSNTQSSAFPANKAAKPRIHHHQRHLLRGIDQHRRHMQATAVALLNCGCDDTNSCGVDGAEPYTNALNEEWVSDKTFHAGGGTASLSTNANPVSNTADATLYATSRSGSDMSFSISLDDSIKAVRIFLHLVEPNESAVAGDRVFDVKVNGRIAFLNVDMVAAAATGSSGVGGGAGASGTATIDTTNTALVFTTLFRLQDGESALDVTFDASAGVPIVAAMEVRLVEEHLAHAVPQGPYRAVVSNSNGIAEVRVDGSPSHTHAIGEELLEDDSEWKLDSDTVLGTGLEPTLSLPVGTHFVTLIVRDSDENVASAVTTIEVLPRGAPEIDSLEPSFGDVKGGDEIRIRGSGLASFSKSETIVRIGSTVFTGDQILEIDEDDDEIRVMSPTVAHNVPVLVSVETPLGVSNFEAFTYWKNDGKPVRFKSNDFSLFAVNTLMLIWYGRPTAVQFGPDGRLYVGTLNGYIVRLDMWGNTVVGMYASSVLQDGGFFGLFGERRAILGLTFDPTDTDSSYPKIYASHSKVPHDGSENTSGDAINGKITVVSGIFMSEAHDMITGLPTSNRDHGVSAIEFGDNGELYFHAGSYTNSGAQGSFRTLKENELSAATFVAPNAWDHKNFNGDFKYSADNDGDLVGETDVEFFAIGVRNSFDQVFHSNGNLYATDNGPGLSSGDRSNGCGEGETLPAVSEEDKIILLERGNFYGFPNTKRGLRNPKECVWRSAYDASDAEYTAPLTTLPSSTDGIIEFQSNHFGGQMRGNLLTSKYKGGVYRVVLSEDGRQVISSPFQELIGDKGLDLDQAPDGTLYVADYNGSRLKNYAPDDSISGLTVLSVFPRRGPEKGGSTLTIHGNDFWNGLSSEVKVGGKDCRVTWRFLSTINCQLPEGKAGTSVDVEVTVGLFSKETYVYSSSYRYITGRP